MHTYSEGDWVIHHNNGFDGDIIVALMTGEKTLGVFRTTSEEVLALVKRDYTPGGADRTYRWEAKTYYDGQVEIDVPLSLLVGFVANRYVRRGMEEWLEGAEDDALMSLLPLMRSGCAGKPLLAVLPDLLEALIEVRDKATEDSPEMWARVDAAIDKATSK